MIHTVGFLQKLSTIDNVTKYRGIPVSRITVFCQTVYYRLTFLNTAHPYCRQVIKNKGWSINANSTGILKGRLHDREENHASWLLFHDKNLMRKGCVINFSFFTYTVMKSHLSRHDESSCLLKWLFITVYVKNEKSWNCLNLEKKENNVRKIYFKLLCSLLTCSLLT